ncbi:MAG: GNAT family N-acetyltransferase [Chthonomonadales bacterium]
MEQGASRPDASKGSGGADIGEVSRSLSPHHRRSPPHELDREKFMPSAGEPESDRCGLWILPSELAGALVRLEALRWSHLPGLATAAQAEEIWTWMPCDLRPQACLRAWMEEAFAQRAAGCACPFAIVSQWDGSVVGSTRFMEMDPANRSVEIGWTWLHPSAWSTGMNTECKYLMLRYAFDEWKVVRVQLKTDARNTRSRRAIERIGGVFEGVLRCHRLLPGGGRRDSAFYSILDTEWPAVSLRLAEILSGEFSGGAGRQSGAG